MNLHVMFCLNVPEANFAVIWPLGGGGRGSLVFPSYHTKSLQTEQNVGCPKKVAINS